MKIKKIIKIIIIIVILAFVGVLSYILINNNDTKNEDKLIDLGYSKEAVNKIENENLTNSLLNKKYSKTLDKIMQSNLYNKSYFNEYLKIVYSKKNGFINNINNLLNKGYNSKEINNIYKYLSDNNIKKLNSIEYQNINEYYKIKNFDIAKLNRYENYKKNNADLSLKDIVTKINIGLDQKHYTNVEEITNPSNLLVLVNKYHQLPSNYEPENLIVLPSKLSNKTISLRKEAYDAFLKFTEDANKEGFDIIAKSGYRSYSTQVATYNGHVASKGKEKADTVSARPGFSEHQTGLAIDIGERNIRVFDQTDAFFWTEKNAYKYGFIIRYLKNKTDITGYAYEAWHIRYLGVELATKVYESGLTYDEYYDLYIEKY